MSGEDDHPKLAYLVGASNLDQPFIQVIRGDTEVRIEMTDEMLWNMATDCLQALARSHREQKRKLVAAA